MKWNEEREYDHGFVSNHIEGGENVFILKISVSYEWLFLSYK